MPVRSRGSLLAGTATLAGLLLASLGCHSSPSDPVSYSVPSAGQPDGSVIAQPVAVSQSAGYMAQPVTRYGPAASAAPVTLQPVPRIQTVSGSREVIASTFQPVQRVSAEQMIPAVDPTSSSGAVAVGTPQGAGAPMPVGAPHPIAANGPIIGGEPVVEGDPAAGNIVLPAPRPLGSTAAPMVVADGGMAGVPPHGAYPPPHPNVPREFEKMALPPYVVEPPDILLIQGSDRITLNLQRLEGPHLVAPDGTVNLGIYGKVRVAGMTLDQVADAVATRLLELMPGLLRETHRMGRDKNGNGKENANDKDKDKVDDLLAREDLDKVWRSEFSRIELIKKEMQVDVLNYNSKFYYVITDGGGWGQQVYPWPITGNETVLDALAKVNGLPAVANKRKVWVARATRPGQPPKILPVDWLGIVKCGQSATNYQLFPGDRVYVDSNCFIKTDSFLAKLISPIQRTLGVTLLGAATVNAIKGTSSGSGLGAAAFR